MKYLAHKLIAAALLVASISGPAQAQDLARLAQYQGADRHERLVEAAKKEGELSVYHVYPALPVVMAAFTKKYGIKVKAWRSGSEAVLQRVMNEARGGRHEVDLVQNNAPEQEAAYRERLLQEIWSPHHKDLMTGTVARHQGWAGITIDIWTAAYNTASVKKEDLPKTYQDLTDPKWKGRLGIEANNHAWFGALLSELGEEAGARTFNTIMTNNGMSARKGHSVLTQLVASGDIPFALTVYSWNPEQLKAKGAPIEGHAIQPLLAQPSTIAIARRSANPASALLFYDFLLGEGQKILADASFVPTNRLAGSNPFANVPIKFIDPARVLDMQDKWLKQFDDMVVKRSK